MEEIIKWKFRNKECTQQRGKVPECLGFTFNYRQHGKVKFTMYGRAATRYARNSKDTSNEPLIQQKL